MRDDTGSRMKWILALWVLEVGRADIYGKFSSCGGVKVVLMSTIAIRFCSFLVNKVSRNSSTILVSIV
jgi:hypothetical protein